MRFEGENMCRFAITGVIFGFRAEKSGVCGVYGVISGGGRGAYGFGDAGLMCVILLMTFARTAFRTPPTSKSPHEHLSITSRSSLSSHPSSTLLARNTKAYQSVISNKYPLLCMNRARSLKISFPG